MLSLLSALILITLTEGLRVIGGSVTAGLGETVVLPCLLTDATETLTQISWQRTIKGKPQNQNFFTILSTNGDDPKFVNGHDARFQFIGGIKRSNGSLKLSNITLKDEGTYSCIFTLFPSGNHKTEIPLQVLVPPVSSLEDKRPGLGDEEVSLVTCTAAASKPPAEVKWLVGDLDGKVRSTNDSTSHDNGTTTTVSSLFGKPTKEINHQSVRCVVSNAALSTEEILPYTIQVYFPPLEVNIREQDKQSVKCEAEANPAAKITWIRSDNLPLQPDVEVVGATLQFLSMTSNLNGLYHCKATNDYGTNRGHLYVHVLTGPYTACLVLLLLLLAVLIGVGIVTCYLFKSGKIQRVPEPTHKAVPTTSNSPDNQEEREDLQVEEQETSLTSGRRQQDDAQ